MTRPFPLAAVLRLRQQAETAAERALGKANAELQAAVLQFQVLQQTMQTHAQGRVEEVGQTLSVEHFQAIAWQWQAMQTQRASQQQRLLKLESQRKEQQQLFLHARRQREMMEDLQTEFAASLRVSLEKQEQRRLDDLSGARFQRKSSANPAGSH